MADPSPDYNQGTSWTVTNATWGSTSTGNVRAGTDSTTDRYTYRGTDWAYAQDYYAITSGNTVYVGGGTSGYVIQYGPLPLWRRAINKIRLRISRAKRRLKHWIGSYSRWKRERAKIRAEAKAMDLLAELFEMVPGQKHLVIPSEISEDVEYRIPLDGRMVERWEKGMIVARYCIQVRHDAGKFPRGDHIITKALMIQANESEFLKIANKMGVGAGVQAVQ